MTGSASGYEDQPFVAEFYDPVYDRFTRHDVEFFVDYSKKAGGRTLELGCGTGRVLIPTAQAGCDITGLDLSSYMLNRCREKLAKQPVEAQSRVRLVQGNMTDFNLNENFRLITIPFRPFQHLISVAEQKACLRCVRRHLSDGGLLVLDVFQPSLPRLVDPEFSMEIQVEPEIKLPDGRILRRTNRISALHPVEQYNDIELIYYVKYPDGRQGRFVHSFPMRYFFRYEMEHLLSLAGFRVVELFGNFDRSPLAAKSPEMIFVTEKVATDVPAA